MSVYYSVTKGKPIQYLMLAYLQTVTRLVKRVDVMTNRHTVDGYNLEGEQVELASDKLTWRPGAYAIVYQNGHLLALTNIYTGRYELPGGGIEIDENVETGLTREVWEETGLSIRIDKLLDVEDGFFKTPSGKQWHTIKIIYLAQATSGQLRSSILDDEWSQNPQWLPFEQVDVTQFQLGHNAIQMALDLFSNAK